MNAAGHHVTHRRRTKHMDRADRTRASRTTTFHVTTGPNSAVIGEKTVPMASIEVVTSVLRPVGYPCHWVKNGLWPCASAYSAHLRNHTCWTWSLSLIHISEPTRRTPISYAVF